MALWSMWLKMALWACGSKCELNHSIVRHSSARQCKGFWCRLYNGSHHPNCGKYTRALVLQWILTFWLNFGYNIDSVLHFKGNVPSRFFYFVFSTFQHFDFHFSQKNQEENRKSARDIPDRLDSRVYQILFWGKKLNIECAMIDQRIPRQTVVSAHYVTISDQGAPTFFYLFLHQFLADSRASGLIFIPNFKGMACRNQILQNCSFSSPGRPKIMFVGSQKVQPGYLYNDRSTVPVDLTF
jgi:hypothetical protein